MSLTPADLDRIEALARDLKARNDGTARSPRRGDIASTRLAETLSDPETVLALVEAARFADRFRDYLRGLLGREPTAAEMTACAETLIGDEARERVGGFTIGEGT